MFVVTLIAAPGGLSTELANTLRNAWGGGEVTWLSGGEAAEFPVAERPSNQWKIWEELQRLKIDLCVQPAENRKKKLLLADMDSTMINQECIDELAAHAGVGDEVSAVTARAMNGELDFEEALNARLGLMAGLDASVIDHVLADRITLAAGGPALLATMKSAGSYCALVSGGFTAFTRKVAGVLGFDEHRANVLGIVDGKLTGDVEGPIMGKEAKVEALIELVSKHRISVADVMAVGDGANDLGMLNKAGAGVALHAKPAVAAQCDLRINHGDLTALLYLQGYRNADFVTPAVASL